MKTKDTAHPGFLLTAQSIDAALKTGRRRLYCIECKGLELTQRQRTKPQFHYYWKDRGGETPKNCRVWLGEYDKHTPHLLAVVRKLWEQAHTMRKAGEPVLLEYPEPPQSQESTSSDKPAAAPRPKLRTGSNLAKVVDAYCTHLKNSIDLGTLSAKTAKPWSFIIKRFAQALTGENLATLDSSRLDEYLENLVLQARSKGADGQSTRQNARACLIHFFDWVCAKGLLRSNPAKLTERVKYKAQHSKIADDVVSRYLVALRKLRQAPTPERLAVTHYLWLMALTGYRRDELATATVGDFNLGERIRRIHVKQAKDGNEHYIGLSHMAVRAVKAQIRLLQSKNLPTDKNALLFPAASALKKIFKRWHGEGLKPMSAHTIYKHHQHVIAQAGIEPFTIHDFRRIFATMAAQLDIDSGVQRLLISHTTGQRETHTVVYVQHRYRRELKEAASKLAVVFDFLSSEIGKDGMRWPLECQDDFTDSFEFWKGEAGRKFANEPPKHFYVVGMVKQSMIALYKRDSDSGFFDAMAQAEQEIRAAQKQPKAVAKNAGHALASHVMKANTEDASNRPFHHLQDDEAGL